MTAQLLPKIPFINMNLLEVDSEIEDLYCPVEDPLLAREYVELRKIVPEDDELCEASEIPPLEDLAMSVFGQAFEQYWFRIALTPSQVMSRLGHYIPTNVDVLKAALVIDNDCVYWKRRTEDRWPYECHDIFAINNDWKGHYIQKYYGEYIEELDPNSIDYDEEGKAAIILSHYIKHLNIAGLKVELSEETNFCLSEKIRLRLDSEMESAIMKQNRKKKKKKLKHKRKKKKLQNVLRRKRRLEKLKEKIKIVKEKLRRGLEFKVKEKRKTKEKEKDKSKTKEKDKTKVKEKGKSKKQEIVKDEETETDTEKEKDTDEKTGTDTEKEKDTDEETGTDKEKKKDKDEEKEKHKVKKKKKVTVKDKKDDSVRKSKKSSEPARFSRTKARRTKRKLFYEEIEKNRKLKKEMQVKESRKKDIINKLKQREIYYNCLKRELRVREIIQCKFCRVPFKFASLKDVVKTTKITKSWNVTLPCNCKCRCIREIDSRLHLATFIGALYRLRSLTISYGFLNFDLSNRNVFADINYQEFYCFILSLTGLKRFRHLKIHLSNLDPLHSKILFFAVSNMNHLSVLEITNCTLNDNGIKYLTKYITGSLYRCRLKVLNLSGNAITRKGAKLIADALISEPIPFIQYLNLSRNNIGSAGAQAISRVIVYNKYLKTIKLNKVLMDTSGITDIALAVFNSSFLIHLDTSCNSFSEIVEKDILEAIEFNTTLESWDLRECGLSETFLKLIKENLFTKKFNKYKADIRKLYSDEAMNVYDKTSDRKELRLPCHLVKNRKMQEILTNMYLPPAGSSISTDVDYDLTTDDEDVTTTTRTPTISKSSSSEEESSKIYSEIKIFDEPSSEIKQIQSQVKPSALESDESSSSDSVSSLEFSFEEKHIPEDNVRKYCLQRSNFYEKISVGSLRSGYTTYVDYDITMTEDTVCSESENSPEQIEEEPIVETENESLTSF